MAIAKFDDKNIEYIYAITISREFIGDRARTAGGNMRQAFIAVKRQWELQTRPMTNTEAYTLLDDLETNDYAVGDFWLDEFSTSTVEAYIPPEEIREQRVQFMRDGVWQGDGRQLTLTVIER